jgi:hypothetical protein
VVGCGVVGHEDKHSLAKAEEGGEPSKRFLA